MTFQINNELGEYVPVFFEPSKMTIASTTEQAANFTRLMIVIHGEVFAQVATNGTSPILKRVQTIILIDVYFVSVSQHSRFFFFFRATMPPFSFISIALGEISGLIGLAFPITLPGGGAALWRWDIWLYTRIAT